VSAGLCDQNFVFAIKGKVAAFIDRILKRDVDVRDLRVVDRFGESVQVDPIGNVRDDFGSPFRSE
jgi:hypothetical protein